ncbi:hypothetical protein [Brachyspira pilosicoli]|uniref:hypothetical protein n=1 Tax=Brachyspira pilosicoli TaxID=52584 RepID=UPI003006F9C9
MSKKIIYLLSLLMALSLVFASCKKNGAGDISGPGPGDNGNDNSPTTEDGLAESSDWLEKNSGDTIKNDEVETLVSVGNQAYFRNPVIVVMGDKGSDVVIFSEKRYKSLGAANDIGIDGNTAVDIVYSSSINSGKKWNPAKIVGKNNQAEATKDKAYAAPVVFKVAKDKVVVVAASGIGLSRTSQNYDNRFDAGQKSELVYAEGTYSSGVFTWTKEWTDMTEKVKEEADKIVNGSYNYKQFSVHSGRGFVDSSNNLYFAVTVSDQGNTSRGQTKEAMGNLIVKGTVSGGSVSQWEVVSGSGIGFNDIQNNYSKYKESRVIGINGSDPAYIAVGSPYYPNNNVGYNIKGSQPQASDIPGSEGSPSYLLVDKWYGQTSYDPNKYGQTGNGSPTTQRLYAHVKSQNNVITMYALQDDISKFAVKSGTKPYTVKAFPKDDTALAKSSSMDVLGDGTIVMVAEQGGSTQVYKVVYKRFTQKFLATQLGIK